jgi:hypothetical protein
MTPVASALHMTGYRGVTIPVVLGQGRIAGPLPTGEPVPTWNFQVTHGLELLLAWMIMYFYVIAIVIHAIRSTGDSHAKLVSTIYLAFSLFCGTRKRSYGNMVFVAPATSAQGRSTANRTDPKSTSSIHLGYCLRQCLQWRLHT